MGDEGGRRRPVGVGADCFGAVRRYWVMVLAVAVAGMVEAEGYSLSQAKVYRAYASVTVPSPVSLRNQQAEPAQYLDSQVLLLES